MIADREAAADRLVLIVSGDAQRLEDAALQEGEQRLARRLFRDQPGDDIACVGILPLRSRREIERLLCPAIDDRLRGNRLFHRFEGIILRPVILQARGMAEQLADRDAVAATDPWQPLCHRVVHRQLALILQQQQRRGGELLGDGRDLIGCVGAGRGGVGLLAIGLDQHDPAPADDRHLCRRSAGGGEAIGDDLVDRGKLARR